MLKIIPEQMELHPKLPVVIGNMDYQEFERRLIRVDEILEISGIERKYIKEQLKKIYFSKAQKGKGQKQIAKSMTEHAKWYMEILEKKWKESDLHEGEKNEITKRMRNVVEQMFEAIQQAHERIIGERKVLNQDKILSFSFKTMKDYLSERKIYNAICPKSPKVLQEQTQKTKFQKLNYRPIIL